MYFDTSRLYNWIYNDSTKTFYGYYNDLFVENKFDLTYKEIYINLNKIKDIEKIIGGLQIKQECFLRKNKNRYLCYVNKLIYKNNKRTVIINKNKLIGSFPIEKIKNKKDIIDITIKEINNDLITIKVKVDELINKNNIYDII